jgi:hypothetical protein
LAVDRQYVAIEEYPEKNCGVSRNGEKSMGDSAAIFVKKGIGKGT